MNGASDPSLAPPADPSLAPPADPSSRRAASILVVDDEEIVRRTLVRILDQAGFAASAAASAEEAARRVASAAVDLVLSDVNMPGDSGLALARALATDHPDIAVVMVTAVDDPDIASSALDVGAFGYVIKPFERNEIVITVDNALRRRALEIENRGHRHRLEELVAARTASLERALTDLTGTERALRRSHEEAIQRLATAAEYRDPFTGVHLRRMSRVCEMVARAVGFDEERAEILRLAAPMHDVGKIGVPDHILLKEGRLTDEEWKAIREHPRIGYAILADSDAPLLQLGATIALTHHERWDGTGYPQGLAGEAIPIEARIVAVADVFDALTSERPYKPAYELPHAVELMTEQRARQFDPDVLDAFLAIIDEVARIGHAVHLPV